MGDVYFEESDDDLIDPAANRPSDVAAVVPIDATQPIDLATTRPFTEQIQAIVGAEQRKSHAVSVTEDVIAGVPVRAVIDVVDTRRHCSHW